MPPILVLLLFVGFLIFFTRLNRREYPEMTGGLWIPTVWMLSVSIRALGNWIGSPGSNIEEGSPLDRSFLIILMVIAIGILIKRKFHFGKALRENSWLVALVAFMLISMAWSSVPFLSLKRSLREIIAIIMGFVVLTETAPSRAVECVVKRTICILVPLSLVLIKYFPRYGLDYDPWSGATMWIGVTDQKNELGQLTSLGAFFLIWSLLKRRRLSEHQKVRYLALVDIAVLAIALYLSKGAAAGFSVTALVMLVVAIISLGGFIWLRSKDRILGKITISALLLLLVIYGTLTPLIGRLPVGDITKSLGRNSTLTQRNKIWAALVPIAMNKPILGHGFGSFWTSRNIGRFFFPAHNGYLEVLLVLGFAGLIIYSIFIIISARKARDMLTHDYDWGVFWICWLIMILLNNVTESSLNSFSNLLIAVPLWMTISFETNTDQSGSRQELVPSRRRE